MTSSAQGQHWEDKIMQPLKTRQSAIDQHFKRSIKLKSGDFVQIIPTEIMKDAPLQLSCAFPGCSKNVPTGEHWQITLTVHTQHEDELSFQICDP